MRGRELLDVKHGNKAIKPLQCCHFITTTGALKHQSPRRELVTWLWKQPAHSGVPVLPMMGAPQCAQGVCTDSPCSQCPAAGFSPRSARRRQVVLVVLALALLVAEGVQLGPYGTCKQAAVLGTAGGGPEKNLLEPDTAATKIETEHGGCLQASFRYGNAVSPFWQQWGIKPKQVRCWEGSSGEQPDSPPHARCRARLDVAMEQGLTGRSSSCCPEKCRSGLETFPKVLALHFVAVSHALSIPKALAIVGCRLTVSRLLFVSVVAR